MRPIPPDSSPTFIGDWEAGNDRKTYTVDDYANSSVAQGQVASRMVYRAALDGDETGWGQIGRSPSDQLTRMRITGDPCPYFGLVEGFGNDRMTNTIPAFRSLIYDAASIEINYRIWMTASEGFYSRQEASD
jgi:hypothetical protein